MFNFVKVRSLSRKNNHIGGVGGGGLNVKIYCVLLLLAQNKSEHCFYNKRKRYACAVRPQTVTANSNNVSCQLRTHLLVYFLLLVLY